MRIPSPSDPNRFARCDRYSLSSEPRKRVGSDDARHIDLSGYVDCVYSASSVVLNIEPPDCFCVLDLFSPLVARFRGSHTQGVDLRDRARFVVYRKRVHQPFRARSARLQSPALPPADLIDIVMPPLRSAVGSHKLEEIDMDRLTSARKKLEPTLDTTINFPCSSSRVSRK